MRPSIGRTVIVKGKAVASNGTEICPAIITRPWDNQDTKDGCVAVNLMAFPDAGTPIALTSVCLYDTEEAAGDPGSYAVAFWPPKV